MLVKNIKLKKEYSWKFLIGAVMIVLSMVIGAITKILIFFYLDNAFWFWFNVIVYGLSWIMLFLGAWWVGKEYADKIKRYGSFKFYEQSLKKGTTKMYHFTRDETHKFRVNAHAGSIKFREKARNRTEKVRTNMKNQLHKVKMRSPFKKKR